MNAFTKTLLFGLSAMFLISASALVTGLIVLKKQGRLDPATFRDAVLTPEEKKYIAAMGKRPVEAPIINRQSMANDDNFLERIAEMANADRANQLVSELRRQKESLDERQMLLDQQWADFQLGKADLLRLQRVLEAKRIEIQTLKDQQQKDHERWAAAQVAELESVNAMEAAKIPRYQEQAKLFEQMKDNAWQDLRRMEVKEIARYLSLMDPKKAGRILILAQKDAEYPDVAVQIHKAMMTVDKDGASAGQAARLARLYSFMTPEAILPYLRDSSTQEIADILLEMEKQGLIKNKAALLDALRNDNSKRELEIQRLLLEAQPSAAVRP